jgi:ribosomal biogenesis protein LAS1
MVRAQFYPGKIASTSQALGLSSGPRVGQHESRDRDREKAVARVFMWMHRGSCPHLVESTALLTASQLLERTQQHVPTDPGLGACSATTSAAVRTSYATAFSRFVTGLLDGQQDKQRKMSMYAVAKEVGLPAALVELRHQITHEQLPSLAKLKKAATNALEWIWEYYWRHLEQPDRTAGPLASRGDGWLIGPALLHKVAQCLDEDDASVRAGCIKDHAANLSEAKVLQALAQVTSSTDSPDLMLRSIRAARELLHDQTDDHRMVEADDSHDTGNIKKHIAETRARLDSLEYESANTSALAPGPAPWTRDVDNWVPKPIGTVS